jgi:hypothetical protein
MQTRQARRNEAQDLRGKRELVEINHLAAKRVGDRLIKLRFIDDPVITIAWSIALPFCVVWSRTSSARAIHQAVVDEEVGESFVVHDGMNDE